MPASCNPIQLRHFGISMMVFFGLFFGLLLPWLWSVQWLWPWAVAGIFGILAIVRPQALRHMYQLWMGLAQILGWVNTRIILGFAFFLVITPIGCTMRLFGYDRLQKKRDATASSYRIPVAPRKNNHLERQF